MMQLIVFPALVAISLVALSSVTQTVPMCKTQCTVIQCKTIDISSSYPSGRYDGGTSAISVSYNVNLPRIIATSRANTQQTRNVEVTSIIDMDIPCGFKPNDTLTCWYDQSSYKVSLTENRASYLISGSKDILHILFAAIILGCSAFLFEVILLYKRFINIRHCFSNIQAPDPYSPYGHQFKAYNPTCAPFNPREHKKNKVRRSDHIAEESKPAKTETRPESSSPPPSYQSPTPTPDIPIIKPASHKEVLETNE